ncbi:serine hydrolase [Trichothermofontia sp.]
MEYLQRLEQQRSRLQAELTAQGQTWLTGWILQPSDASAVATTRDVVERLHALATLEWQVQAEVWAAQQWQQAIDFASQASTLGNLSHPTLATWYQAKHYWQMALDHLRRISAVLSRRPQVISKYREYRHNLDVARYRSELLQSAFLRTIVAKAQLSPQTRITVCRVAGECRHYGGNAIVESPASLIKIPVAIAVLHQLQQGRVSLGTPITVIPGNFTEDPADIQVGKTYPLQVLLSQMLSHSSNIATNQLIDYFGWDTLNQSLQQAGYRFSQVHFKLMGQTRMPANPGSRANTLNSDELSRMMQQIYLGHSPGHRVAQQALANQQDRELGIRALAHHSALWVGEKTGRTSSTLGTTVALKIQGDLHIITIVDQTGQGECELRQGIRAIATYLEQDPAMKMSPPHRLANAQL